MDGLIQRMFGLLTVLLPLILFGDYWNRDTFLETACVDYKSFILGSFDKLFQVLTSNLCSLYSFSTKRTVC